MSKKRLAVELVRRYREEVSARRHERPELIKTATKSNLWSSFGGAVIDGEKSVPRNALISPTDIEESEFEASAALQELSSAVNGLSGSVFGHAHTKVMSNALKILSDALYDALFAIGKIRGQHERYKQFMSPR
jgi:hypothetical protein